VPRVGLEPFGGPSILAVTAHGPDAMTVTFQDVNGALGQRLLYRADEAALSIVRRSQGPHRQRKRPHNLDSNNPASKPSRSPGKLDSGGALRVEITIQRRTADPKVFSDVLACVPIGLHPLRGGNVVDIRNLAGPPELDAASARCCPL
jgi:hypothetical protein